MNPKQVRKAAGLSLIQAAVGAGKAENTVRMYEANRGAVSEESRAVLDAFYAGLAPRGSDSQRPTAACPSSRVPSGAKSPQVGSRRAACSTQPPTSSPSDDGSAMTG
jgi:hypothetical protein